MSRDGFELALTFGGLESYGTGSWSSSQMAVYKADWLYKKRAEQPDHLWFIQGISNKNTSVKNNTTFLRNKISMKLKQVLTDNKSACIASQIRRDKSVAYVSESKLDE
jgi:hypothetical protein